MCRACSAGRLNSVDISKQQKWIWDPWNMQRTLWVVNFASAVVWGDCNVYSTFMTMKPRTFSVIHKSKESAGVDYRISYTIIFYSGTQMLKLLRYNYYLKYRHLKRMEDKIKSGYIGVISLYNINIKYETKYIKSH